MKKTILTIALGIATLSLGFAQTPAAPAAPAAPAVPAAKPVAATNKTVKKHHNKAVKNTVKTAPASTTPAPVKQ